jgi:fused signal recognition particle receptor
MVFNFFKKKKNDNLNQDKQEIPELVDSAVEVKQESTTLPDNEETVAIAQVVTMVEEIVAAETNVSVSETITVGATVLESTGKVSWAQRLKAGLSKTRDNLSKKLLGVFGGGKIDEALYEELETVLLSSDMGLPATTELLNKIRDKVSLRGLKDGAELKVALKDSIAELLLPIEKPLQIDGHKPFVIMLVGVNGAGKTTSIGKLAKYFQDQGKSIMLAAGDTFRAAAREQLIEWGKRNNVAVISQAGGDSAAVCYDAIQSAIANKIDIVLADTAGRLPTQLNLMEEIKKVKRVIGKALDGAPHEVLLVLDSNIGQNALNQVRAFDDALGLTGLVLTKLDGTAKGGVICAIARERPIALRFIGVGETINDLRPFNAKDYAEAICD